MTILSTKNLSFMEHIRYPDISITAGRVTFFRGPSGTGKSTLLRLFNATTKASSGSIYFHGNDISAMDKVALRRQILLAEQIPYLFQNTITGNFSQFHMYHESPCPTMEEMVKYLNICCGDFPLDSNCMQMSGGERQRIFLAIALSLGGEVLMMDEPTSALDGKIAFQLMENIISHCKAKGTTLLVVSHDNELIEQFAEDIVEVKP